MRTSRRLLVLVAVSLALLGACGDFHEPTSPPTKDAPDPAAPDPLPLPPPLSITLIGGNHQEATSGTELARPFDVRVTGPGGVAAEGVAVTWQVTSGVGTFRPAGVTHTDADGRSVVFFTPFSQGAVIKASVPSTPKVSEFRVLPPPFSVYEAGGQRVAFYPDSTFTMQTGTGTATGQFARNGSVLSLSFAIALGGGSATAIVHEGSLHVDYDGTLEVDGFVDTDFLLVRQAGTSPGWFENPGATVPVVDQWIVQILGNGQEAPAGAELPEAFVARVLSPTGSIAGARIVWRVEAGAGSFRPTADTRTDRDGESLVHFTPLSEGTLLSASVPGTSSIFLFRSFANPIAVYGTPGNSVAFYANSSFALRLGAAVWTGAFTRSDSLLHLAFDGSGAAEAVLRSDSLIVTFLGNMALEFYDLSLQVDRSRTVDTW